MAAAKEMEQFNIQNIETLQQAIEVIEVNYINKLLEYLKRRCELGYNNAMFTKSYL